MLLLLNATPVPRHRILVRHAHLGRALLLRRVVHAPSADDEREDVDDERSGLTEVVHLPERIPHEPRAAVPEAGLSVARVGVVVQQLYPAAVGELDVVDAAVPACAPEKSSARTSESESVS